MELDQLREKGLASTQSYKLNKSGTSTFLTPEEAEAYIKSSKEHRAKNQTHTKAPSNLSKAGMNDWYHQQKNRYIEEKKKRMEAERFLRGYRQSYCSEELSVGSGTTVTTMSTHDASVKESVGGNRSSSPNDARDSKDELLDKSTHDREELQQDGSNSESSPNLGDEIQVRRQDAGDVFAATNDIELVENIERKSVDPIGDREIKPECTTDHYHTEDLHGIVGSPDTILVVQQLDGNDESLKPGFNNVPQDDDNTNHSNASITKDLLISMDKDDPTANLPTLSETAQTETNGSSTDKIDNDGKTENVEEAKDQNSPQTSNSEGSNDFNEGNVISESRQEVPQENEQQEDVGQSQADNSLGENANVPCSVDLENYACDDLKTVFQAEVGRYHLYISHACPFAHRTAIVLGLKGLQEVIGVTHMHPTWQFTKPGADEHRGWVFGSADGKPLSNTNGYGSFPSSWGQEDPHNQLNSIRDLYEMDNDDRRQYTVPVLWDTKLKTIVSNNSTDIMRIINSEFNAYALNPELDLYPEVMRDDIDNVNNWMYTSLNDGVYNCGLAESQEAYETAIDDVTDAFDKVESILKEQRYIVGDNMTEADVRLFATLLQFDEIYSVYFKANTRSVSLCPTILKYVRKIYYLDGVKETCDMEMIKAHYYTSHVELNKYSIIPRGEDFMELLQNSKSPQ